MHTYHSLSTPPLRSKLVMKLASLLLMALFISAIVIWLNPLIRMPSMLVTGVICLVVLKNQLNAKFVQLVKIDPFDAIMFVHYITFNGNMKVAEVNLRKVKHRYFFLFTQGYEEYLLEIRGKTHRFDFREPKRRDKKPRPNSFSRAQLDEMNLVINKIKSNSYFS